MLLPVLFRSLSTPAILLLLSSLSGCERAKSQAQQETPPQVTVVAASTREVTDWDEFTGRFEAVQRVELRPRVSGYIEAVRFTEGSELHKGATMFLIDARSYRVELDRAGAQLARAQAQVTLAETELQRARKLLLSHAISVDEHDRRVSQQSQSIADLRAAQAAVDAARLNLEHTHVTAPIDGRVSRAAVTAGNYVTAGETILTSLVSLDPIYVSFEGDEHRFLKEQTARDEHPVPTAKASEVFVGLANEDGYPHTGHLNFIDNAVDPTTGTIHTRAILDNKDRRFTPGLFARVRLPGGKRYQATLVPDAGVGTDQDRRYVLVVNKDDVVEYRTVELGGSEDALRIVLDGVQPGERVVVGGLHRAKPGSKVVPVPLTGAAAVAQASNQARG